jgi:predicted MFS family arabinose efflux permease
MRLPGNLNGLRAIFAKRMYRIYVAGSVASNLGLWIWRISVGWLTWQLTESTAWLGGMAVAEIAPLMIFGFVAGTVVDRSDILRLLRRVQLIMLSLAAVIAVLTFADLMTIWILCGITVLRGVGLSFMRPSRMSLVYAIIGRDHLPTALAVNSLIFNSSRFIGPAIGGAVILWGGVAWGFAAAVGLFCGFTLCLHLLSIAPREPKKESKSLASESVDGIRYLLNHSGIRMQMVLVFSIGFFARPLIDLFPGFAARVFAGGPETLAMLMSGLGLGAIVGGLFLASRTAGTKGLTTLTLISMLAAALTLLAFSAIDNIALALPLVVLMGGCFVTQGIGNQTLIQSAVDPAMRGRVLSLYGLTVRGMPSIGALIMGVAAESMGLQLPVAGGAMLCLLVWAWAWRGRRAYAENLETDPGGA